MDNDFLTGTWVYRSFYNNPDYAPDFNKIRLAEAELTFEAYADVGQVRGQMTFRSDPPEPTDARLIINGSVQIGNPNSIHVLGLGVPGTEAEGWQYEQVGYLVPKWPSGIDQRPAIVGMVTRRVPHSDGAGGTRPSGFVGSFIAVKRDIPEPRQVIPLPPMVLSMLAGKEHRLHHAVWHAVQRIPFVNNGSGEDFLFMHRQMIEMVREACQTSGAPPIEGWKMIPPPGPVSIEPDYSTKPAKLPPPGNPDGFAVMPNWAEPGEEDDARRQAALKSDQYYWLHLFPASQKFQDPVYLATLSLGALGALIEWTIHNDMHMRWTSEPVDPVTGQRLPDGRNALDLDPKWDDPKYDSLSEPYSSLVNPVFWRLHGWIDDRIDDWFLAHELVHPGQVIRKIYGGVDWFEQGKWVALEEPWAAPADEDRSEHGGPDIPTMELVNMIVFGPEDMPSDIHSPEAKGLRAKPRVQWFGSSR
jgi:hypothetical protein